MDNTDARERLLEWLKPGDTVYTILRHRSSSGMTRHIGLVLIKVGDDGKLYDLHPNVAAAEVLGRRLNKNGDGVVCQGAGMDMGFDLVYSLSRILFGDGYALNHRWL